MNLTRIPASPDPALALWLVHLDMEAQPRPEWQHLLSPQELERAGRFHFESDARRYRISHAALRSLLARLTGLAPLSLAFAEGRNGKPRLRTPADLHFNMSHSGDWALIGVSHQGPVGVDIEAIRALKDVDELARSHFTPHELQAYRQTPAHERLHAFFRCWTRKEACLKALGSGLSIEPQRFEAGAGSSPRSTTIMVDDQPCDMTVCSIELPFDAMAAVARLSESAFHLAM